MSEVDDWIADAISYSTAVGNVLLLRHALHQHDESLTVLFENLYQIAEYFSEVERPGRQGRPAVAIICNQAVNDFIEVLTACETGAGRTAVRACRSLLEHAANLATVLADQNLDERYLDHLDVSQLSWGGLSAVTDSLIGNDHRSDRHHRRKALRDGTARLETLAQKYGPSFARQWHPTDLRTRVAELGWPDEYYDYYRLSSAVIHGAAYGQSGLRRAIDGTWVHRVGPAWQLCSDALLYALLYFKKVAEVYGGHFGVTDPVDRLIGTLSWARGGWHQYRAAVLKADEALWPDSSPIDCYSVVGLAPHGLRRWFVVSASKDIYAAGLEPPDLTRESRRVIDEAHGALDEGQSMLPSDLRRPSGLTTIAVHGVAATPADGAVWRPTDGLFGWSLRPDGWIQEIGGEATLRHRLDGREI